MDIDHEDITEPNVETVPATPSKALPDTIKNQQKKRRGNPLLGILLLLPGVLLGILGTLYALVFIVHDHPAVNTTSSTQASQITVQVSNAFLTRLVANSLTSANLPGKINNVRVSLSENNTISITGNDTISLLFLSSTQPFTLTLQLYTQACQPKINILHASLGSLPVTNFAQSYDSEINRQIQQRPSDLPTGFTYCATSTRTQTDALFIVYSATPI